MEKENVFFQTFPFRDTDYTFAYNDMGPRKAGGPSNSFGEGSIKSQDDGTLRLMKKAMISIFEDQQVILFFF